MNGSAFSISSFSPVLLGEAYWRFVCYVIDVQRYDSAYSQFEAAVKEITEAVVQPKPMGQ